MNAMLHAPAFWWKPPGFASAVLAPAGALYGAIAGWRLAQSGARAPVPVVCVGDPTLGGGGKTPTVIALSALLQSSGAKPFIISRGYRGKARAPKLVDPARMLAAEVGDEPLLLAHAAPTVVAADRVAGAHFAVARGASVLLLDDGFQNPSLTKDVSLLVLDSLAGIGNGRVFPAGPLRAPLAAQFARADALIQIGAGAVAHGIAEAAAKLPVLTARLVPDPVRARQVSGKRVFAFAGIARPDKFFLTLAEAGAEVVRRQSFPDHHVFSGTEAAALMAQARSRNLQLVTTEKDLARMKGDPALAALTAAAISLPVRLEFADPAAVMAVLSAAAGKRGQRPRLSG